MLKKHHQFFNSMLWLFDMAMVTVSFALAYLLRFEVLTRAIQPPGYSDTLTLWAMSIVIFSFVFRGSELYQSHRLSTRADEVFRLFKSTALSLLLLVAATYFLRDGRYSRLTFLLFGGVSFVMLASTRTVARQLLAEVRRRGFNARTALIIGSGDLGRAVVDRLEARREYGIQPVGILSAGPDELGRSVGSVEVIGRYAELEQIMAERQIDQVYIALPLDQHDEIRPILKTLSTTTADVKVVPDLYQFMTLHGGVEEIDGIPVVALRHGPVHGWDAVAKRAFDLFFGTLILVAASPVMLVAALLVKLTSKGPVFYAQERMGLDGRTFSILKFRSMRTDAEAAGAKWATAEDDRVTAIGALLRKYSLDELPQFINVLRGDMSLVGPRPERPVFIETFKMHIPGYNLRHKVKAGITGLAQVEGWRGSTSLEKRIERDLYYIEHWSLWLDFTILVRTAFGGFLNKNAY
jgi:Undecaprenyl-phosphate glucose phosphotransferase